MKKLPRFSSIPLGIVAAILFAFPAPADTIIARNQLQHAKAQLTGKARLSGGKALVPWPYRV